MFCCGCVEGGGFAYAIFDVVREVNGVGTQEEICCDRFVCTGSDSSEKCVAFCIVVRTLEKKVCCRFWCVGTVLAIVIIWIKSVVELEVIVSRSKAK